MPYIGGSDVRTPHWNMNLVGGHHMHIAIEASTRVPA